MNNLRIAFLIIISASTVFFTTVKAKAGVQKTDTAVINQKLDLSKNIIFIYPDSAFKYADTALILSKQEKYRNGIFKAHNYKGIIYSSTYRYPEALQEFRAASLYYDEEANPRDKAIVLSNIGLAHRRMYNDDSALFYYTKTINFALKYNITDVLGKALMDQANVYLIKDDYVRTAKNLLQARDLALMNKDSMLQIFVFTTFGILYNNLNKLDTALYYYRRAAQIDIKLDQVNFLSNTYINIGEVYFDRPDYDSAMYYYKKAVSVALPHNYETTWLSSIVNQGNIFYATRQNDSALFYYNLAYRNNYLANDEKMLSATLVNLGLAYLEKGDKVIARKYLLRGVLIADSIGTLVYKKNALEALARLDSLNGDYKGALDYYIQFKAVSDSINAESAANQLATLEFDRAVAAQKFNNESLLKQDELKSKLISNQKRVIVLILTGILFLILLVFLLLTNRRKIKKLLNDLESNHERLKTKQEQLKELNSAKDRFLSILGHDLKGPISGFNELLSAVDLQWENISDVDKHESIRMLRNSSEKTYNLLEDLLNWGKARQGILKPDIEPILVLASVSEVVKMFESKISGKNIELKTEISPDLQINTDVRFFSQIIQNLLNNAIKYTFPKGIITIKADVSDGKMKICLSDTGIGIPADKIPMLFDVDAGFNRPGTEQEKSTGMGLLLCKEYADLIDARIIVESIENEGSTFCLVFK